VCYDDAYTDNDTEVIQDLTDRINILSQLAQIGNNTILTTGCIANGVARWIQVGETRLQFMDREQYMEFGK